jgi:hypothetical protein
MSEYSYEFTCVTRDTEVFTGVKLKSPLGSLGRPPRDLKNQTTPLPFSYHSCSLCLFWVKEWEGCFFLPIVHSIRSPLPSLYQHTTARNPITQSSYSNPPTSSSEKPHVQNQLSINIANGTSICYLLVCFNVSNQNSEKNLVPGTHIIPKSITGLCRHYPFWPAYFLGLI